MKKSPKSPKKQSAKITKLKMRVGEITSLLLQNHPKMVRMRKGGSSGYADLFMSKQLMKGGKVDGDTQNAIVDFLKKEDTKDAVKALKEKVIANKNTGEDIKNEFYKELYDYKLCDKYDNVVEEDLQEDLITLDIVQKFYLLVKDKKIANVYVLKDNDFENYKISVPANVVNSLRLIADVIPLPDDNDDDTTIVLSKELKVGNKVIINDTDLIPNGSKGELIKLGDGEDIGLWEVNVNINGELKSYMLNPENLTIDESAQGGKLPAKYKSLGIAVHILYKKRKYKRTIYVKDKKKTKYCKIDGEYILLSKMKVIA
jgi:hypothetical protein